MAWLTTVGAWAGSCLAAQLLLACQTASVAPPGGDPAMAPSQFPSRAAHARSGLSDEYEAIEETFDAATLALITRRLAEQVESRARSAAAATDTPG